MKSLHIFGTGGNGWGKTPSLSLSALFACFVMLSACSQAPGLSRLQYAPRIDPNHKASPLGFNYTLLYSFGADPDGSEPFAGVVHRGDNPIYGTTAYGGADGQGCNAPRRRFKALPWNQIRMYHYDWSLL